MQIDRRELCIATIVIAGGGQYRGIQRGSHERGIPDLILFNDPLTGTTLALVANDEPITALRVRARIRRSRVDFQMCRDNRCSISMEVMDDR
jgi:hypothetical protein